MSEQTTYVVARGCIRRPRVAGSGRTFTNAGDFINQGEIVPADMYSAADIASWLAEGRIVVLDLDAVTAAQVVATIESKGKWTVDPATLAGKSMDELLIMVYEIDDEYDGAFENEAEVVRHLTQDWSPEYNSVVPAASDRSKPAALALNKLEQTENQGATSTGTPEMSAKAQDALAQAKQRANAPKENIEPTAKPAAELKDIEVARAKIQAVRDRVRAEKADRDKQPTLEPNAAPEARVSLGESEAPSAAEGVTGVNDTPTLDPDEDKKE